MLIATFILAFTSIGFALALTPIARDIFVRLGLVDQPTGGRKIHATPIPRVGGIAMAAAIVLSVSITYALGVLDPFKGNPSIHLLIRLLPAVLIIFVVGVLDDLFNIKAWHKLLGQLIAASVAYAMGLRVMGIAGYTTSSWVMFPLTIGWLLICTNAFNLIDGVDGLAAGAGLFATLTILLAGIVEGNSALVLAAVPLGGALLGFLRYNFKPATAFLGDSGSLLLGFLLGCFGVIWSFKTATVFGMIAPLMAMSVPILDVTLSIARRFLRGKPIFGADRGHVHHKLLDRGLTHRRVVLLLYGACGFGAVLSLLQSVQKSRYSSLVILLFCAGTWLGIRRLAYGEFSALRKLLFGGAIQRSIDMNMQLRELEVDLEACTSLMEWWAKLCEGCRNFGFVSAHLNFSGLLLEEKFAVPARDSWGVDIALDGGGSLRLTVPRDRRRSRSAPAVLPEKERRSETASAKMCTMFCEQTAPMVMPFIDLISKQLPDELRVLHNEPAAEARMAFSDRRKFVRSTVSRGSRDQVAFQIQGFDE